MITPEISNFINSQRSLGMNDAQIRQALLANGWSQDDVNQVFDELNTSNSPISVVPKESLKNRILGLIGIIIGIIVLGAVPFLFVHSLIGLLIIEGGGDVIMHKGLPLFLIPLICLLIGLAILINSIRFSRVRAGQKFHISIFQKLFWPIVIAGLIVFYFVARSYQPSVKPLDASNASATAINPSAGDMVIANFIDQSFPNWYKNLDPTSQADLVMAYKVMHMLYENPIPNSVKEYEQYGKCASSIIDPIVAKNPIPAPLNQGYYQVYLAFKKQIDQEVGINQYSAYTANLGNQSFNDSGSLDDKTACANLNIPQKYK
ncbi:MAG: hypothetical protein JWO40_700 [Candidatus Doudnabacteria bacterium]|nr:hypothetical protein [Candidatus Doudnabacteria bacterium]